MRFYAKAHDKDIEAIELFTQTQQTSRLFPIRINVWAVVHSDFFYDLGSGYEEGTPLNRMQQHGETICFNIEEVKED